MATKQQPNIIYIDHYPAIVSYIPELKMFRGKFLNTTGYCDFIADSVVGLYQEGKISLDEYLADCRENGIVAFEQEKQKTFTLRYDETLSELVTQQAKARGISINRLIIEAIEQHLAQRL
ncbi:type II toxin-antitoxin system HicB family antitoxin [Glaesserella parasuis]|nr:type II toxin-antitoxin system HicB family antitoxin [Glaesserella parasuis]